MGEGAVILALGHVDLGQAVQGDHLCVVATGLLAQMQGHLPVIERQLEVT